MTKKSEIKIQVLMDDNNVAEKINWDASDSIHSASDTKAILMSLWDSKSQEALRIDLWTKDMRVDEMKLFFYQTLLLMSETLERATNEDKMVGDMRDFCHHFREKLLKG